MVNREKNIGKKPEGSSIDKKSNGYNIYICIYIYICIKYIIRG